MDTSDLILFTQQDGKRVVVNANAIESVEEIESQSTRITTRNIDFEVSMAFDEVTKVLASLSQQNAKRVKSGQKP